VSTSAPSVSSIALPPSALEAEAEAKEKAKKKMGGLDIKFYSQKGGASVSPTPFTQNLLIKRLLTC
jgi:hypothetical protein